MSHILLLFHLLESALQIQTSLELGHVHVRHKERSLSEEIAHLLKRSLGGLREDSPEEEGVGEVADLRWHVSDWARG